MPTYVEISRRIDAGRPLDGRARAGAEVISQAKQEAVTRSALPEPKRDRKITEKLGKGVGT